MSVCFHPHLLDAERFEALTADAADDDDDDARAMALMDCFVDDDALQAALGDDASDVFAGRYHPETKDYLGGVVDAVLAALPKRSKAAKVLRHASCLEGRFSDVEPALGYLEPAEVEAVASELAKASFAVRGLEADRLLLLKILDLARARGRGVAFMAV